MLDTILLIIIVILEFMAVYFEYNTWRINSERYKERKAWRLAKQRQKLVSIVEKENLQQNSIGEINLKDTLKNIPTVIVNNVME